MPALPIASISDQATYLKTGFSSWFGDNPSSFNLTTTGTGAQNVARELIYDYDGFIGISGAGTDADGLSAARRVLVDRALRDIGSKFNITFRQAVAADPVGNIDLFFKDNEGGASASSQLFGTGNAAFAANHRYIDYVWINISADWNSGSNADNDYTYQTFYHEILHGLGLGHAGAYNGGATYITDSDFATSDNNTYINDSWEMSVMSYFDQRENTTVPGNISSYLITMMAADVEALRAYYGTGTAFTGNTIYGVGTNILATTSYMLANLSSFANSNAFCIVDDGGIDTVNFSNFSDNQRLDLTVRAAGDTSDFGNTTSDIGGRIRNMTLAAGTIIENAVLGGGNDSLTGNSANNLLSGGGGDDSIYGFDGNDTLNGDAGNDNLNGGNGNDTLNGGNDNDTLNGGAGNDRLNGGSGNDSLVGGAGIDTLNGGDGNDTIISDGDTGIYNGDAGDDLMFSGFGQETMNGGTGIDTINHTSFGGDYTFNLATGLTGFGGEIFSSFENAVMGGGNDIVTGNASNNIIQAGAGNDIVDGGDGNDTLTGEAGSDSLNGGSGNDSLLGGAGIDTLNGGDGNDTISSDGDAGIYNGDAGDDVMFSGLGSETMNGGTGIDTINHTSFAGDYTFNLTTGLTNFAGESFSNFENAVMGGGNDNVTGNASNNIIQAGVGNDIVDGGDGNDTLTGEAGSDSLNGSAGDDSLNGGEGNDSLNGGSGNDSLLGGAGIDTLNGGDGNDTISSDGDAGIYNGDAGDDVMFSGLGSETMNGGTGTDTINHTAFSGNYTFNLATGLTNFAGESFSNFENAVMGGGNDNVTGNASNNIIQAGAGNDTLNGGAGSDRLTGSGGSDIFILRFGESIAAGFDTIAAADGMGGDYQIGIDRIDLLTAGGGVMAAPVSFWRAGNSAAATVPDLLTAVFADADGVLAGNQILGVNAAAFVVASTAAIAGNYVIVNDGMAGFQAATDLVFKVNVLSGSLPVLGVNSVSSWFV